VYRHKDPDQDDDCHEELVVDVNEIVEGMEPGDKIILLIVVI